MFGDIFIHASLLVISYVDLSDLYVICLKLLCQFIIYYRVYQKKRYMSEVSAIQLS